MSFTIFPIKTFIWPTFTILAMTGDHIEEVVDLVLVVHGDLRVACVTSDRVITILTTTAARLLRAAAFLVLQWE